MRNLANCPRSACGRVGLVGLLVLRYGRGWCCYKYKAYISSFFWPTKDLHCSFEATTSDAPRLLPSSCNRGQVEHRGCAWRADNIKNIQSTSNVAGWSCNHLAVRVNGQSSDRAPELMPPEPMAMAHRTAIVSYMYMLMIAGQINVWLQWYLVRDHS